MTRTGLIAIAALALAAGCGGSASEEGTEGMAAAETTTGGEGHHAEHGEGHHAEHGEGHHAEHGEGHQGHGEEAPAVEPARVLEDGTQLFGADLDESRAVTPLGDILEEPASYEGRVVTTEGEITQVCQARGCWMEIRADAQSPGIRVPMANHAFFLPRDVSGRHATLEGTVVIAALSEEDRAHLEAEGAEATDQDVSIEATGVLVHP